ncbi:hypothetical protein Acr_29g0008900 [Actinidia rufa]|uniref:HAT C-terminal dimerisation domain-containing protein n=1 Tax=Actinidia rufa TaxID=165716 RepID=A0A7J0HFA8_9ERIC|nr:hypothetical protein Acr_29g0008900 [Actinidia rufa]
MDANAISHGQGTAQAAGNDMTRTQVTEQDTAQAEVTSKRCRKNNKGKPPKPHNDNAVEKGSGRVPSRAWTHFNKLESENSTRKAECKYCKKVYVADSKFHGTNGEEGVELVSMSFSVEAARKALAEMIVTDELSFSASEASNFEVDDDCDDPHALIACQFSSYLEEEYSSVCKNKVDKYLRDYCEGAKNVTFDILAWWKANSSKYLALSQLARDVLAMPISTVASESTFSTGGRILDPFRSSLSPMMVEVLICAQNWLRSSLQISLRKAMDSVEDFEKQCEIG